MLQRTCSNKLLQTAFTIYSGPSPGIEGGSLPSGGGNSAWCICCMDLRTLLVLSHSMLGLTGAVSGDFSGAIGSEAL